MTTANHVSLLPQVASAPLDLDDADLLDRVRRAIRAALVSGDDLARAVLQEIATRSDRNAPR